MIDFSSLTILAYPFKHTFEHGRLEIYDKRGFDKKGYSAYLFEPGIVIPMVGIGPTPETAVQDIFTCRLRTA